MDVRKKLEHKILTKNSKPLGLQMTHELQDRYLNLLSALGDLLVEAAREGNLKLVKELVECRGLSVDVDHNSTPGLTALQLASQYGHLEVVQWLIVKNVNLEKVDHRGRTAVYHAVKGCQPEILKMLVKQGANLDAQTNRKGFSPLHKCVIKQYGECFKILIDSNCDLKLKNEDGDTPLHMAVRNGMVAEATSLIHARILCNKFDLGIRNKNGFNVFHESILAGNLKLVTCLLELGRDDIIFEPIDETGLNVFHLVCEKGHTKIAELLVDYIKKKSLERSIAPTTLPTYVNAKTRSGQTPLILACYHSHYSLIEVLVDKAEVSINVSDNHGNCAISNMLMGMESGIVKIPTKSECDDSEIYDIYMELKSWDSETVTKYPSLASVCYLLGAGDYPRWNADGLLKLSKNVSINALLERYVSKYIVRFNRIAKN